MSKFKKIDRAFQLSDSSVNVYGYRLLTEGYLMDEYKKNPIGYYMHGTIPDYPRESGVLVKWEDLCVDGDKIMGKPVINLNHPRGEQTAAEIENGFLNAASIGKIVALEISNDVSLMLTDQTGPTITKWYNRECSLVDLPGNMNATAAELYDKDDKLINLADFTTQKNDLMKQIFFTAAQLAALNLSDNADTLAVGKAFNDLMAQAQKVPQLETANTTLMTELANLKKSVTGDKVKSLLAQGLTDKKITAEVSAKLEKIYENNPDGLKDLIDALPAHVPVTQKIKDQKNADDLSDKTWSELHQAGKLEDLKASNLELFKDKYKEEFKKEYKG